jgi:hypothetical protein
MNELKEYLIDQMINYKKLHDDLFYNEESIIDMSDTSMEDCTLYEGILEGLAIALEKIKRIESK